MQRIASRLLFFYGVILTATPLGVAQTDCPSPANFLDFEEQRKHFVDSPEVIFVTHLSGYFDPVKTTRYGANKLVEFGLDREIPIFYLHDSNNYLNPFTGYMYNYCEPDEYIHSDIGHHFLNLRSSNKIYVAGGYFEMCQQNTVTDSIQSMALNPSTKKITIMQVLDAVFSVAQEKRFDDPFYPQLYDLQQSRTLQTGKFTVSLSEMLDLMSDPNIALEYLSRRINRMPLPSGWGVSLVYKNKVLKLSSAVENKEIVFEFLSADELKSTEN